MAMSINSSPVLTGESARAFIEEAELNSMRPTRKLSKESERILREIDRKSHELYSYILGLKK